MILRFFGHACFGVQTEEAHLCIDPFESGGFGGAVTLPPLPDAFTHWIATHEHGDHNAGHTLPSAVRVAAPPAGCVTTVGDLRIEATLAAHDEFGGKLRGGLTALLRVTTPTPEGPQVIVHCGDLGERPTGALLDWLLETPIDVLIVPVGGYFTLGPDGAAEVVRLVQPRTVVPCHAREHGVSLPELGCVDGFFERVGTPEMRPRISDTTAETSPPPVVALSLPPWPQDDIGYA